ncbi:cilia- and flagella-associated protein 107 [Bombina bombina]|uniref:cilia- and flagella-associated protein 107 n=1 Tax=Bombina bombina TaxID=8345 RepID=UPI00235AC24A|nr:cilia- and flagella-associated protein 107 [Bombina bombina]
MASSEWKIQQRYSNKVLIGNWVEERKKFEKFCETTYDSCYRSNFISFPETKTDYVMRRYLKKKMEGLPKQFLLSHHGEPKDKHLVSSYDDNFIRHGNPTLPPLRKWNGNYMAWLPEKSKHPIEDPPTNFGRLEEKKKQWSENSDLKSIYSASYKQPPSSALITMRYGVVPRILSSSSYTNNNVNKSLHFRGQRHLHVPDFPVGSSNDNSLIRSNA